MSDTEKRRIYDKRKYLKKKIIEKCKIYHDLGGIQISLAVQIGSNRDKNICMSPKARVTNQPLQMVKTSVKAEILTMCQQFVEIDPSIQEKN